MDSWLPHVSYVGIECNCGATFVIDGDKEAECPECHCLYSAVVESIDIGVVEDDH